MLRVVYRTDPNRIADLLPPGLSVGAQPTVHVHFYQVPIKGEPEYGCVVKVRASFQDVDGYYLVGNGIDQESAIFISHELNGQPKFPCSIDYYRLGSRVVARATHQGYTFVEFSGEIGDDITGSWTTEVAEDEWWLKYLRATGGREKQYDFPPHVVRVSSTSTTDYVIAVDGELVLRESPWDPIAELLPIEEQMSAVLYKATMDYSARSLTLAGTLDPDAFWPYADTIGGSRWPGVAGGPRRRP
jgi:acetoacetate decarboxylase